jgi:putative component of toxin-antitoxin plasmid stabilization module
VRDGIHELRIRKGHVNCRILYFFHGRDVAVLGHALAKEDVVPDADIERALMRKVRLEKDPEAHIYEGFRED